MHSSSRRTLGIVLGVVILVLLALLLTRCSRGSRPESSPSSSTAPAAGSAAPPAQPAANQPDEALTPATIQVQARVTAGAEFPVAWTGPANPGDYITIVRTNAAAQAYEKYREVREGSPLKLTAPIEPGGWEVRYVTVRSKTILGRAPITVAAPEVTLSAAEEVILGKPLAVTWTGPNNAGDYITLVPKDAPDGQYGNYTDTARGSPLSVTAPTVAGDAELRYIAGQGGKVLARRPVRVITPETRLSAQPQAVAGSTLAVTWSGPDNPGDYITVVAKEIPDGQYGNYSPTSKGSPLDVLLPIMSGDAELRYMTGQGGRVLARFPIRIVAAEVTLSAPEAAEAGSEVTVTWTGPNHSGDYITVVERAAADGRYGAYTQTSRGSPLTVTAPKTAGEAEVRYMTGQGGKVIARRPIRITP